MEPRRIRTRLCSVITAAALLGATHAGVAAAAGDRFSSVARAVAMSSTAPGAPTIGTAVGGDRQALVSWTTPVSNGGSAITGYVVTPFVGYVARASTSFSSTATTEIVTGLVNGTTYRFKVAAVNAIGTGASSAASNAVTPVAGPRSPCDAPVSSAIACENSLPGAPPSAWLVAGSGDSTIRGFASSMSVNKGQTLAFKIKTPAASYRIDILRIGYYQGNGARKVVAALRPSALLPQTQPACLTDGSTGLVDCGNWKVSASWAVPANAVSGVYIANLVRDDTGGSSQIVFVVRDDASHSDLLYQTSDTTWAAYNSYGGFSLYTGSPRPAYKVSYNRPLITTGSHSFYSAEYPMVRFLEASGYDVTYSTGVDSDAATAPLANHKAFLSVGHDEYWSGAQRANVEAARSAGVHLAFFSGNEVFWKTRWEPSIDSAHAPRRTLVSYKETHANAVIDPQDPSTWTGTWRDPRFSPPADGGRPENALTGQFFIVSAGTTDIQVPAQYRALRFWRGTAVADLAPGDTLTLAPGTGTLGYEWDEDADNGFRPAGLIDMSSTTATGKSLTDYGSTAVSGVPRTHHLTLYRAPSGALVFGAGTVQWSWGLDSSNPAGKPVDRNMQQATTNLLADMGAQPATLIAGLTAAAQSTDITAPASTITWPLVGTTFSNGAHTTISGTAADSGGGTVAAVEVSTDGGVTWHPAIGTSTWTFDWSASGSPSAPIMSRAVDDSGNLEPAPSGSGLTVQVSCPCSIWSPSMTPPNDSSDQSALELGVRFTSDTAGYISGIRYYKATTNTGTHSGSLWTSTGELLATATFGAESAQGWQQVSFATPVPILAGVTYVASYHAPAGHYSYSEGYFYPPPSPMPDGGSTVDAAPLHAPRNTGSTVNGVYAHSTTSAFPTVGWNARNYYVDVVYTDSAGPP